MNCPKSRVKIDTFYDHRKYGWRIFSRFATIGDNIVKTPLARLMKERYGKCGFHYYDDKEHQVFMNNPYVTEFVRHTEEPNPAEFCVWPWPTGSVNVCQEWCRMYGFQAPDDIRPELFPTEEGRRRFKALKGAKPVIAFHYSEGKPWLDPDGVRALAGMLTGGYDVYQVGNDDFDCGVRRAGDNVPDLIDFMSTVDVFVGSESGPQHVATAFGKKCFVLAPDFHKGASAASENWSYPHLNTHILTAPRAEGCICNGDVATTPEEVMERITDGAG